MIEDQSQVLLWRIILSLFRCFWIHTFHKMNVSVCLGKSFSYLLAVSERLLEALLYKPEGRGFDSRLCHSNFSLA